MKPDFLGPILLLAHCVWLSDNEIGMMAETATHISHNPNSNAKLGNGIARIPEMLAAGINVGLGNDAVECNNSADMFEVMKYASLLQRASRVDPSLMPTNDVIRMATNNGAKALGHETGQLSVGKKADIILVDTDTAMFTPLLRDTPAHMTSHLIFAANGSAVDASIIDGAVVMRGRELEAVFELGFEHGMNENRSVSGAKAPEGLPPDLRLRDAKMGDFRHILTGRGGFSR